MTVLKQRMLDDLRIRNYAPTTVDCYIRSVTDFAKHFNKPPDRLGEEEIAPGSYICSTRSESSSPRTFRRSADSASSTAIH